MKVSIVREGQALRTYNHEDEVYAEAPSQGQYVVRIYNNSPSRRMAVVSVDGINVINGKDADFQGPGYVLSPWQTLDIPGWRRDGEKVAAFTFSDQKKSYAAKTKRGTNNVGIIGVAVFDEKVKLKSEPFQIHYHYCDTWWTPQYPWIYRPFITFSTPDYSLNTGVYCSTNTAPSMSNNFVMDTSPVSVVGTSYGAETSFHTVDVEFERASTSPVNVITLRYATRECLKAWGVKLDEKTTPKKPSAFPGSASCPAPAGWDGR